MKKKVILGLVLSLVLSMTACKAEQITNVPGETVHTENGAAAGDVSADTITPDTELPEVVGEPVDVTIYYGNADADGFETKTVNIAGISADHLLQELAAVNVVSVGTAANSLRQEGVHLYLDLNENFSQYLNMMGTSGEYIVVGGVVDTFLDAYGAEDILITVDGNTLQTSHAIYDAPLLAFHQDETAAHDDKKVAMPYQLSEGMVEVSEKRTGYFPQFTKMSDTYIQNEWNSVIKELASANNYKLVCDAYSVDYRIGYIDEELVSFIFTQTITNNGNVTTNQFALTFDLVEGKIVRLGDLGDRMATVAYNMANQGYYRIDHKSIDREAFDEVYDRKGYTSDDYSTKFLYFDYDKTDLSIIPEGTTFVNENGEIVLIMKVDKAVGEEQLRIESGVIFK